MRLLKLPSGGRSFAQNLSIFGVVLAFLFSSSVSTTFGLTSEQKKLYQSGIFYFDIKTNEALCGGSSGQTVSGEGKAEIVWNFFTGKGLTPVATAGIMGNFNQESTGFDPARKQSSTTKAIPAGGDGTTGFGIAQWTSPKERQSGLFAKMKEAGLEKYHGAGWGHPEINKDMPLADIQKLLLIELDYAWEGDTTKVMDIADQLNAAQTTTGDSGSTVLFHKLFERSDDNASQIQERVDDATGFLGQYEGTTGTSSCAGELGGVATMEDAIPWAMRFIEDTKAEYNGAAKATATLIKDPKNQGSIMSLATFPDASSEFVCWGAYGCDECTTLSGWFVTKMTGYTYGGGNGGEVVGNLKAKGVPTGTEPRPFSVFSYDTGSFGHTGVVLGTLGNGMVITLENNWPTDTLSIRQYDIKKDYPGATFAYVGDKLKVSGVTPASP